MKWVKVTDVIDGNTENFENCIYMWKNKVNQKLYIGQAKDFRKRTREHKNVSFNENQKYGYNYPIHRAVRKYGVENFEVCVLEYNLNDYDEMNEKETYYIEFYNTLANKGKGYNVASGGGNGNPYEGKTEEEMEEFKRKMSEAKKNISEETKQKLSENHADFSGKNNPMYGRTGENSPLYGKHRTKDTKKKISEANKGKQHTEETKQKISEAMKGKQHTEETKQKISENHAQLRKVVLLNTGEIFTCIKRAEEKYGVASPSISANCRKRCKSAGKDENGNKLVWMYYEEYLESLK